MDTRTADRHIIWNLEEFVWLDLAEGLPAVGIDGQISTVVLGSGVSLVLVVLVVTEYVTTSAVRWRILLP